MTALSPRPEIDAEEQWRLLRNPNWDEPEAYGPEWRGERRVLLHDGGLWSPTEGTDGTLCLVLPVFSGDDLLDVVAWERARPKRLYRLHGIVTHLGAADLAYVRWDATPTIKLADSVASWLLTPPPCCVIVDWTADLRRIFRHIAVIECPTAELGRYLNWRLAQQVHHGISITTMRSR
jgi:hypothetical protein